MQIRRGGRRELKFEIVLLCLGGVGWMKADRGCLIVFANWFGIAVILLLLILFHFPQCRVFESSDRTEV